LAGKVTEVKKNDAKRLEAIYTPAPDGIENLDLFVGKFLR